MGTWSPGPAPTSGNDIFTGDATAETASGGAGNDTLNGDDGDDLLDGGSGDDTLNGNDGNDHLRSLGPGGGSESGTIGNYDGGAGNDWIEIDDSAGVHHVVGGADTDILTIYNSSLLAGSTITGVETVAILGGALSSTIATGLLSTAPNLFVAGRWYQESAGTTDLTGVNILASVVVNGSTYNSQFQYYGSNGNDVLILPANAPVAGYFEGNDGDDSITAGAGADTIHGENGNDTLNGGAGDDLLVGGAGNDTFDGGAGNDRLRAIGPGGGTETGTTASYSGGAGNDWIQIENSDGVHYVTGGADADLLTFYNTDILNGSTISGVETVAILGGAFSSTIAVGLLNNIPNLLVSGRWYQEAAGANDLSGTNILASAVIDGATVNSQFQYYGSEGDDTLILPGNAPVSVYYEGNGGGDTIVSGAGNDVLWGEAGDDTLNGGGGDDYLHGDAGDDTLNGGDGDDRLRSIDVGSESGTLAYYDGGTGDDWIQIGRSEGVHHVDGGDDDDLLTLTDSSLLAGSTLTNVETVSIQGWTTIAAGVLTGIENLFVGYRWYQEAAGTTDLSTTNILTSLEIDGFTYNAQFEFYGSDGNDTLILPGNAGGNMYMEGNGGNDVLNSGVGNDSLYGEAGDDTLDGGAGNDFMDGGAGVNTASYALLLGGVGVTVNLGVTAAQNTGAGGNDTLRNFVNLTGSQFGDALTGTSVANVMQGLGGDDDIFALGGADAVSGGAGDDMLDGGDGDDTLDGGANADELLGGLGNDVLIGAAGNDVLNGGDGVDTASFEGAASGVAVNLAWGGAQDTVAAGSDAFVSIENLAGSAHADTLVGDDSANRLRGVGGNDWLVGGGGDDRIEGGVGVNVLIGGAGTDLASYASETANLWVDLGAGVYSASGVWDVFFESIEGIEGGSGADTLFGDAAANRLEGGLGADTLIGRNGSDSLLGQAGDDWLDGGEGDDVLEGAAGVNVLVGGNGTDLASYASATTNLWVNMAAGVYSASGVWDVFFNSIEGVRGGSGADRLFGNTSDNRLEGGAGDDALIGDLGHDTLVGDAGSDWLVGGNGDDRLIGGEGVDVLTGGAGADVFDLGTAAGWDVAFDFNTAQDRFSLGGLQWLGFITYDADGDGQADDTLLGYAGGNFVALNVAGLTLTQWNALVDGVPSAVDADKTVSDPDPEVLPSWASNEGKAIDNLDPEVRPVGPASDALLDRHSFARDFAWADGGRLVRGFQLNDPFVLSPQDEWAVAG